MENRQAALRKLLTRDLPLEKAAPSLRHAIKRALAVNEPDRLHSLARSLVSDLKRQNQLFRVAVEGQNNHSAEYFLVRGSDRLVDLGFLENGADPIDLPSASDLAPPLPQPVVPEAPADAGLSDFVGMLGAMEHAQDLEIGFPQSGETGVILDSILRLLGRFTPQFDLFILLFEKEILPEGQGRIFTIEPAERASGWLALRKPTFSAWIPSPAELPRFIRENRPDNPHTRSYNSAVAVPVYKPMENGSVDEKGHEMGLLFLVAHEEWGKSPLLRLAKRLSRFVTRRWQHQREVNQRIHTDSLTRVYNRAFFDSQFTLELERARRSERPLSLVICDIDHFKGINDQYLHHNGDRILQMVARRFKEELRRIDHICRIGGEEFALILPETSHKAVNEVMDRLVNTPFCEEIIHQGEVINIEVTFSFGVATFPEAGSDAFELYRKADAMLFLSKDLGRNQCHFWNPQGDHLQLKPQNVD